MKRRLLSAGLLVAMPAFALAQDEKALGKDDIEFANQLVANGYPDLAERLLGVVEKKGTGGGEAGAQIRKIKLDIAQDTAMKLEDLIKRKDALLKVLADKEKFIDDSKGATAAEDVRNTLPELYDLIGQTLTAAIKKEKEPRVADNLRSEGDSLFQRAEQVMKNRIDELKAVVNRTPEQDQQLEAARYNYPHTIYYHSLVFPSGSDKRTSLCKQAMTEYDDFELEVNGDNPPMLLYYSFVDYGFCQKETGELGEAVKSFDKAIVLRESYGPKEKNGVYPIPPAARDIADIVCYAMWQKMIVLGDQKKADKVIEVGKDYFASTPKPFDAPQSMLLAKVLAEAQIGAGDGKGAKETAERMMKTDENGIGSKWSRELMEKMGGDVSVPYTDKLKNAETRLGANDYDAALGICRRLILDVDGTPDAAEASSSALSLVGFAYEKRRWFEEAALAYETALERYPKAKGASEALWRAITMYQSAMSAGRRRYYKDHIDALTTRLITEYPKDPRAADIQLVKAKSLESDGDWLGAVAIYAAIQPTSAHYTKAFLLTGIDYFNLANKSFQDKKPDDAAKYYAEAEKAFKSCVQAIGERRPKTLDKAILDAYDEQEYLATLSLAKLYMNDAYAHFVEASAVIDTLEAKWGKDPKKVAEIQNRRGALFLQQGKFDEAEKWVNELYARDKIAAAGPAGLLARALDTQATEKAKAKPGSAEADELWKRAARFYYISIKPQVDSAVAQHAEEMIAVGNRLYSLGLHFNGVPEDRTSFVDWVPGSKKVADYWLKAAEIYEAALAQTPDIAMTINLGRTYGFLAALGDTKRWVQSATLFSKLFTQELIINPKAPNKLDPVVTKAKSSLVGAYLDFGVAEQMSFSVDNDKDHLNRALKVILAPIVNTLKPDTGKELYWGALYHMVRTLIERGEYKDAKLKVEDVQRQVSPTFDEGKFGYKALFEATIAELSTK